jgi:hemolysin activation/secretion protein
MYGLGLNYKKLNYLPNPSKGLNVNLEALLGTRKILNDTTDNQLTSKFLFGWEHFIPIHKRWVLRYFVSFESYQAPMVYSNECYRFGGLNSQRGFNEENFLATSLSTNQVEIRYLLDKNSAVFAFFDQTIYENNSNSNYRKDLPFGFGVGANIGSKVGIFSLVYALGSENNNPLDVRSGKIHFGYIAYF